MDPLFSALSGIDGALLGWMPAACRVAVWALVAGVGSMLLYRVVSNQERVHAAAQEVAAVRGEMVRFDGEFSEMLALNRRMFTASMRHLAVTALPALVASLPLLPVLFWMGSAYEDIFSVGPQWVRGWECLFFAVLVSSSLAVKWIMKIR